MITSAVVAWAIILVGALSASVVFRLSPARTIPLGYAGAIVVGFILGLSSLLTLFRWVIPALSAALLVRAIWTVRGLSPDGRHVRLRETLLQPGLAVFTLGSGVLAWVAYGRRFVVWDEYSHWGLAAKNMHVLDAFANVPSANTYFRTYPPGATVLEYFYTGYSAKFSAAAAILGLSTFGLALMLPIAERIPRRLWVLALPATAVLLFLPTLVFSDFSSSTLVDPILGLLTAYVLVVQFGTDHVGPSELLQEAAGIFVLCLVKPSGLGLAVLVTVFLVADQVVRSRIKSVGARSSRQFEARSWGSLVKATATPVVPLFGGVLASTAWKVELALMHTPASSSKSVTLGQMVGVLGNQSTPARATTRYLFVDALVHKGIPSGGVITMVNVTVFSAATLWLLSRSYPRGSVTRTRVAVMAILAPMGAWLYSWTLLTLYLNSYSSFEALHLASFVRYEGTFALVLLLLIFDQLLARSVVDLGQWHGGELSALTAAFLAGALIPWAGVATTVGHARRISDETQHQMARYDVPSQYVAALRVSKAVYYIHSGSQGFSYWAFRYAVAPAKVSPNFSWSFGPKSGPNAMWNTDISASNWAVKLRQEYGFVYVYQYDSYFARNFGNVFCPGQSAKKLTLYRVRPVGKDSACIVEIPAHRT